MKYYKSALSFLHRIKITNNKKKKFFFFFVFFFFFFFLDREENQKMNYETFIKINL